MKGVTQLEVGNDQSLVVDNDIPIPVPGPREILIRVRCAAVNRMDIVKAKAAYPTPPGPGTASTTASPSSEILGVEVSGTIISLGDDCQLGFQLSESVCALLPGGGYAEFACVDERTVLGRIPAGLDGVVAAAIPEAFLTAYQLLFVIAQMKAGESVLMHAAASSVGQAAIQLAARKSIRVFATSRSEDKCLVCQRLGAQGSVNTSETPAFSHAVKELNGGKPVNVVLCPVGSAYLLENLDVLGIDGRLVLYGTLSGGAVNDPGFLGKLMSKRIQLLTSTLSTRSIEYKQTLIKGLIEEFNVLDAVTRGDFTVAIEATYMLEEVLKAHDLMRANANAGKIVLLVSNSDAAIDTFAKELKGITARYLS